MMKNMIPQVYFFAVFFSIAATLSLKAQVDTVPKPARAFTDPKATDDNSKVLLDTTERTMNMVDSLLDNQKPERPKRPEKPGDPPNLPSLKKVPADKARVNTPPKS